MIGHVYVLAKNEEANLRRCLAAAVRFDIPITVLDSGSTDGTRDICTEYSVQVEDYAYVDHCSTYNELTARHDAAQAIVVLDADMLISSEFLREAESALTANRDVDVVTSPISMWWAGAPLHWGSLYPPKPLVFRGGNTYFEPLGHGERLRPDVSTIAATSSTIHDDRRAYRDELLKQLRYAEALNRRSLSHDLSIRDFVRVRSPLFLLVAPLATYVFKLGFLSGRVGLLYAVDRLIAEAITYRVAVYRQMRPGRTHDGRPYMRQ